MSFRYQEESSPQDWVQSMADNMQSYEPEDFICGDVLLLHYDHEVRYSAVTLRPRGEISCSCTSTTR